MEEPLIKRIKTDDEVGLKDKEPHDPEASEILERVKSFLLFQYQEARAVHAVVKILSKVPCCARCTLRYLGVKDFAVYQLSAITINHMFVALANDNSLGALTFPLDNEFVCSVCFGTVQSASSPAIVDTIVGKLYAENYDVKAFNMSVTLPPGTFVRQRSVEIHLGKELVKAGVEMLKMDAVDMKEVFKLILAWAVENEMSWKLDFKSKFRISVTMAHEMMKDDNIFLEKVVDPSMKLKKTKTRRNSAYHGYSKEKVTYALQLISDLDFSKCGICPPSEVESASSLSSVELKQESSYVAGRYLKFARDFSQTPWEVEGVRLTEFSVSETIGETLKRYWRADEYKFVSAGREDANVRMLGDGRPFYFELINPRSLRFEEEDVKRFEDEINALKPDAVQVRTLRQIVSRHTATIKQGEETKSKSYRALVWISEPASAELLAKLDVHKITPLLIKQMTPLRVLQRRAQMVRLKTIHHMHARPATSQTLPANDAKQHFFFLNLQTEAGTYIKEFVHGDLGRTRPNLGELLGVQADILDLDVLAVDLEWPPQVEEAMKEDNDIQYL